MGCFAGRTWKNKRYTNCLNYCDILMVYTQFSNVAAGRIIQTGGPQVGDPCLKGFYQWHIAIDLSNVFRTAHRLWFLLCHSVTRTSSAFQGGKKVGRGTESGGPVWNRKYLITGHYMAKKGSFSGGHGVLYLVTDVQGKER